MRVPAVELQRDLRRSEMLGALTARAGIKRFLRPFVDHARAVLAKPRPVESYPTYEAALAECGLGYSDPELAEVTVEMTRQVISHDVRRFLHRPNVRAALKALKLSNAQCVLDFGGSCGLHYFLARQEINRPIQWAVVETPVMVRASSTMGSGELQFFADIDEALRWLGAKPGLVFTSGAVQMTPRPESVLTQLMEIGAPYVALLREALALGPRRVTIQTSRLSNQAPGHLPAGVENREVKCPRTFMSRDVYSGIIKTRYRSIYRGWLQHELPLVGDGVELRAGYNFVCVRK